MSQNVSSVAVVIGALRVKYEGETHNTKLQIPKIKVTTLTQSPDPGLCVWAISPTKVCRIYSNLT